MVGFLSCQWSFLIPEAPGALSLTNFLIVFLISSWDGVFSRYSVTGWWWISMRAVRSFCIFVKDFLVVFS